MRQAWKSKCKRSKFSHPLLSLSFLSFFSSVKCFLFDFFGAALTLVHIKLNYVFRRELYIEDPDVRFHEIKTVEMRWSIIINASSFFFKIHDTNKHKDS